ncbi:MAG: zinc ribbon domain-containing protein [Streptosporangiales bacterium]|nr:zinc ribbon domain-containing protein [Streptosporangiales bacterium]
MARYEYQCRTCGDEFEVTRPMTESSAPTSCACGAPDAARVYSSPAMTGRAAATAGAPAPAAAGGGGGGCCGGGCCG